MILPKLPVNPKLKAEIVYKYPLKAPIHKGDEVATLRVISQSNAQNDVPLYAAEDVTAGGVMRRGLRHHRASRVPVDHAAAGNSVDGSGIGPREHVAST